MLYKKIKQNIINNKKLLLICLCLSIIIVLLFKQDKTIKIAKIKMSSLNYLNSATRVGFDFKKYYNDFNNEGHMYPFHGVGDLDTTLNLFEKIVNSISGKVFSLTDLGIKIQVSDKSLMKKNPFFDYHNIPTKHLDGSTKLPDGTRVEQHIPYFNKNANRDFPNSVASIDWISGDAIFENIPNSWDKDLLKPIPTTLSSTRQTPFLKQDENLALSFFMDGKQARVTNGGKISNYRYIVPAYATEINWFVARAWVPCKSYERKSKKILTTNGKYVWVRPRTEEETDNLDKIAYKQNRYMETISQSISILNTHEKVNSFNQRYGKKSVNFGDLILLDKKNPGNVFNLGGVTKKLDDIFNKWVRDKMYYEREKQIAFYEIISYAAKYLDKTGDLPSPYVYIKKNTKAHNLFSYIKNTYINTKTYDISITALAAKSQLSKSYIPTPVGETGWMVVDKPSQLKVPNDNGEYFIGWTIKTQPSSSNVTNFNNSMNGNKKHIIRWCQNNGYAIHQGPGLIFLTGGDFAHHGTQEPYLLEHNYPPVKRETETEEQFKSRILCQLPNVHWRLDKPDVIFKSNIKGNFTEANVGAAQNMLLSIGTTTSKKLKSRSPNFLGRYYQDLLANPENIKKLTEREPKKGEVYKVIGLENDTFVFGNKQSSNTNISY